MEYDFEDPNFDFAGNAEIIAAKLRKAREMQNTEAPQGIRAGNVFAMSRPDIGGAIQRGVGRYEQAQAEQARGSMNTEQLRRYDELSRGLNEMKPIDYSNPDEAVLENSRRMALAGQMAKLNLPMAQKAAETYLSKGAAFPETIAQLKMKQIEAGEQNAMKLREKEMADRRHEEMLRALAAAKNQTSITIAGMPSRSNIGGADKNALNPKQELIMRDKHAKDWAAAEQAATKTNIAATNADELLEDPGFNHLFGTTSIITRQLPAARQAVGKLESLKSNLKAAGLEAMRAGGSIGAMTEKEWPIVEAMISGLDERMSPSEARAQIDKIKARIERINDVSRDAYKMEWGATPYYKETGAKSEPTTYSADKEQRYQEWLKRQGK